MDSNVRREEMMKLLKTEEKPISATRIGERLRVSRQIIVGDVALLRASGAEILATPRGYILDRKSENDLADSYVISCEHDVNNLVDELYIIVDNGGEILNVSIDHPIYGAITQPMNIKSRFDADGFASRVVDAGANLLCSLTQGAHMHTVRCENPDSYRRILMALKEHGILRMG